MLASPIDLLLFGALVGVLLGYGRNARFGRTLALAAILILVAAATLPIGMLLIAPLEDRFPPPPAYLPPPEGIIVLGGAIDDVASAARGETVFDEGGERLTEAVLLARRYPQARIVYAGGSASLTGRTSTEALRARNFMVAMGVAPERVTIEDKSRTTFENARLTAAIVHPQPSQAWIIVTSAFHMPRAMGVFEKAGFHSIAYPVAFRTLGGECDPPVAFRMLGGECDPRVIFDPAKNLHVFQLALHEWIGLTAYWASGRMDYLFPGPGSDE
jgi:uncharacterized SAM-binding protein YcdF (DUF218 family)